MFKLKIVLFNYYIMIVQAKVYPTSHKSDMIIVNFHIYIYIYLKGSIIKVKRIISQITERDVQLITFNTP